MAVRVRLTRVGSKKNPIWRVVVADQRSPRDGRFIELIGSYNPQTQPSTIVLDRERLQHWLDRGAEPTNTVRKLMRAENTTQAAVAEVSAARAQEEAAAAQAAARAKAEAAKAEAEAAAAEAPDPEPAPVEPEADPTPGAGEGEAGATEDAPDEAAPADDAAPDDAPEPAAEGASEGEEPPG